MDPELFGILQEVKGAIERGDLDDDKIEEFVESVHESEKEDEESEQL